MNNESTSSRRSWEAPVLEELGVGATAAGVPAATERFQKIGPITFQYQGPTTS